MRLFFALWPELSSSRQWQHDVALPAQMLGGRQMPMANLHMTLAFLGEVPGDRVNALLRSAMIYRVMPSICVLIVSSAGKNRSWLVCVQQKHPRRSPVWLASSIPACVWPAFRRMRKAFARMSRWRAMSLYRRPACRCGR